LKENLFTESLLKSLNPITKYELAGVNCASKKTLQFYSVFYESIKNKACKLFLERQRKTPKMGVRQPADYHFWGERNAVNGVFIETLNKVFAYSILIVSCF